MRVFFTRAARYLITAPEASWGWGSRLGVPWCSKCNESLRFVFVTDADPHVHISSYFKPKAVRCACFTKRATTRAPIPIEPCLGAPLPNGTSPKAVAVDKAVALPPAEEATQHTFTDQIKTEIDNEEAHYNEAIENWPQQQETEAATGEV